MTTPSGTMIYAWIIEKIGVNTPTRLAIEYVREAIDQLAPGLDELARENMAFARIDRIVNMLVQEQVRATSAGLISFEVIGDGQDAAIKGFAVGLPSDSPEMERRRHRAALAGLSELR